MLINLTQHTITLCAADGARYDIPPSGHVARVSYVEGVVAELLPEHGGVPIFTAPTYGPVTGLPPVAPDTVYIVSQVVASRVPSRIDVVYPGTGPTDGAIREDGRVIGVTRLVSSATECRDVCIYCGYDNGPVSPTTHMGVSRVGWDCVACGGN